MDSHHDWQKQNTQGTQGGLVSLQGSGRSCTTPCLWYIFLCKTLKKCSCALLCRKWVEGYQVTEQFTQGHTDVMPQEEHSAGDWIFMSRVFGFFAKQVLSPHPICAQRHVPSSKNRQSSRGMGCLKSLSSCNHTWLSIDCPPAQHGIMVSEQSSLWSRTMARKVRGGLTLFGIFLLTSITTCTITLSIKLRSPSRLMMEHSRPFSTLGTIADGSLLHHSNESPWVQRYFISLQHVSAFSLPMTIVQ